MISAYPDHERAVSVVQKEAEYFTTEVETDHESAGIAHSLPNNFWTGFYLPSTIEAVSPISGPSSYDQPLHFRRWEEGRHDSTFVGSQDFLQMTALAADQITIPLPQEEGQPAPDPAPKPGDADAQPTPQQGIEDVTANADTSGPPVDINPFDRDIELTVPLTFRDKPLGEVPIVLTKDDTFRVETAGFLKLVNPLLSEEARQVIGDQLAGKLDFTPEDLGDIGITLEYDPSSLSVVVLKIDPNNRAIESLFAPPTNDDETVDVEPAKFSAFLNINVAQTHVWGQDVRRPSLFLNGVTRFGNIVAETELEFVDEQGFGDTDDTGGYNFQRNFARLVYDQPEQFRRWELGDLSPEVRGQQGFVQLGGIGVTRQRRRFNEFRSSVLQGNRRIVIQRDSTVTILRNGSAFRELRLEAGSYDLSSLPLLSGSNDVQIEIRDDAGRTESVNYQAYLDPIDLDPGDYEYAAYIGALSNQFGGTPNYSDEVAFTGFFRKAFLNRPSIGLGVQASKRTQLLTGQTQFVLGNGGQLQLDGGVSRERDAGAGFIAGATYQQSIDRSGLVDSFTIRADYTSRRFSVLGQRDPDNVNSFNLGASYARAFSQKLTLLVNANYLKARGNASDRYRLGASASYRLSRKWSIRGGLDYSRFGNSFGNVSRRSSEFGFNISLVFQPNYRTRAEARHDSTTNSSTLSYTRSGSNRLGSVGYGGIINRQSGSMNAQGFASYSANRFDAGISHTSFGEGFNSITDEQATTVRIGTSLAFADGAFGIGRRINDSFAVLYPHKNLGKRDVVAGQSIAENRYLAKSGPLGGAVNSFLTSYVNQTVQYDIEDPPIGYDVGPGTVRIRPPYKSGYKIRVGMDAFASARGTLIGLDGKAASYTSGKVEALDGKDEEPIDFFTNSVGRFSMMNLRPGVRYRVTLRNIPRGFEFVVPSDTTGLTNLGVISLLPNEQVQNED
ncbi:fimbria/pilus outer membrane usher protein [Parasphingorhabdus sp.]